MAHSWPADLYDQIEDPDAHIVLSVVAGSSTEVVKTAYRTLALLLHPDKCPEKLRELHTALFQKLQEAYITLVASTPASEEDCVIVEEHRLTESPEALHRRILDNKEALRQAREKALFAVHYEKEIFMKGSKKGCVDYALHQKHVDLQTIHKQMLRGKVNNISEKERKSRQHNAAAKDCSRLLVADVPYFDPFSAGNLDSFTLAEEEQLESADFLELTLNEDLAAYTWTPGKAVQASQTSLYSLQQADDDDALLEGA